MYIDNLHIGVISEKELLDTFGTPKQKESYEKHNGFASRQLKDTVLKTASRYATVQELGQRRYKVVSIYPFVIPKNFNKMNSGLYQYIIPLVLESIIRGHDENNKISLTIGKWARHIKMVNANYNLVKYNASNVAEELLPFTEDSINEFYDKSDVLIEYYIQNALNYLKSTGAIIWQHAYRVRSEFIEDLSAEFNGVDNSVKVKHRIDDHVATDEELEFYTECLNRVDRRLNIKNDSERYYSKKATKFTFELSRELATRNIKYVYKTYNAYYVDLDKCEFLYSLYRVRTTDSLVNKMTAALTQKLKENAKLRYKACPNKYVEYGNQRSYVYLYTTLCDVVINNKTEYLDYRITKKDTSNINLQIETEEVRDGVTVQ